MHSSLLLLQMLKNMLQSYADKLHCHQYELIREIIEEHPYASFDSKCKLIQTHLMHEETLRQMSLHTIRDITMTGMISASAIICMTKILDYLKVSTGEIEKTSRCYFLTHPFQK